MPLDVNRLRKSETRVRTRPDEFRAAIMLWCAAWHEVPAGSVPDDDIGLADLAGYGVAVREWKRVRAGALRGFVKCADGRFYHPVIVGKAINSWRLQLERRHTNECGRLKKEYQRNRTPEQERVYPSFELWITTNVPEAAPHLSLGTAKHVPRDNAACPPNATALSPEKQAGIELEQNNEDLSDHRFPGDSDSSTPPAKAVDASPPTPDVLARVIAECERAKLEGTTLDNAMILRWISHGATPTIAANALAEARRTLHGNKPMTCAYVDPIIERLIKQDHDARRQAETRVHDTQRMLAEQREAAQRTAPMPDSFKPRTRAA